MLISKIKTAYALGFTSVGRAIWYWLGLRMGLNSIKRASHELPSGSVPFFSSLSNRCLLHTASKLTGNTRWYGQLNYFSWVSLDNSGLPPDWFYDPFTKRNYAFASEPWWRIPDFDEPGADIKSIWELSRFDWLISLSQRVALEGDSALEQLNSWLHDWVKKNPPYIGPNWKCGQEASIRVMHLIVAALLLRQQDFVSKSLISLIDMHLKRIRPTLMYALAQDNNHGTSEAAALWMGGSFLVLNGGGHTGKEKYIERGRRYESLGARFLNERVRVLIMEDGSFSQYSVNYHRFMLETLSLCEVWARINDTPVFSQQSRDRIALATRWLSSMVIAEAGDVPNIGANDGAHLLPLTNADYRDFRPAVNLASFLFCSRVPYKNSTSLEQLLWLGFDGKQLVRPVDEDNCKDTTGLTHFPNGGFITIKRDNLSVFFRYPRFRFRPGQCDALHVDVWRASKNILRDAGSYSYNAPTDELEYFSGPSGHNTIEFDHRAAMPKLSRFLYGEWLKPEMVSVSDENSIISCQAGYKDWQGVTHQRRISLLGKTLTVVDTCAGFSQSAVLRWRLINNDWQFKGNSIASSSASITIRSNHKPLRLELVTGYESRYYFLKTELPVLEVEFGSCNKSVLTITTEIKIH